MAKTANELIRELDPNALEQLQQFIRICRRQGVGINLVAILALIKSISTYLPTLLSLLPQLLEILKTLFPTEGQARLEEGSDGTVIGSSDAPH